MKKWKRGIEEQNDITVEEELLMGLFVMGILLWSLVIASVILFIYGLWKSSWKALVWSGAAILVPMMLIFLGGQGIWFRLSILVPIAIFAAAYYMKQKTTHLPLS
nr:hypothetical protein [Planococcus glaciei]